VPGTDDFKAPLYYAARRYTYVSRPRPLLAIGSRIALVERCGESTCDRIAAFAVDALLDEHRPGEVHICTFHAQPLLEA
jgi:hypothetical protein